MKEGQCVRAEAGPLPSHFRAQTKPWLLLLESGWRLISCVFSPEPHSPPLSPKCEAFAVQTVWEGHDHAFGVGFPHERAADVRH